MARKKKKQLLPDREANKRTVMTMAPERGRIEGKRARFSAVNLAAAMSTVATSDPSDRAHLVRLPDKDFPEGRLVNADRVAAAKPRRYHVSYMHSVVSSHAETQQRGDGVEEVRMVDRVVGAVSDETVFDETHAKLRWLQDQGLDVFGPGSGRQQIEDAVWGRDGVAMRGVLRRGVESGELAVAKGEGRGVT